MNKKARARAINEAANALADSWLLLDFETTGVRASTDRIISYFVVSKDGQELEGYLNPGIAIPANASRIHGIYDEDVIAAPSFPEFYKQLAPLLNEANLLVAYNAGYDLKMLRAECLRYNLPAPQKKEFCLMLNAAAYLQTGNSRYGGYKWNKLGTAAHMLGVKVEGQKLHGARYDVLTSLAVWQTIANKGVDNED